MSTLKNEQDALMSLLLQQKLSTTSFACSEIRSVDGGSVNYVYRGTLRTPFQATSQVSDVKYVLIKHAAGHLSINRDFLIDVSRWRYEVYMLRVLEDVLMPGNTDGIMVRTPKVLYVDKETCTQVIEYIPSAQDLAQKLNDSAPNFSAVSAFSVGFAVGSWLRGFHDWSSDPEREMLQQYVRQNEAMGELKFKAEYGVISKVLSNFPEISEIHGETINEVLENVERNYRSEVKPPNERWRILHGDFWSGK